MKRCPRCENLKSESEFHRNAGKADGLGTYCMQCQRAYGKLHYARRTQYYVDKANKRKKELRKWLNAIKSRPCMDCGCSFHPCAMDFDHREGEGKTKAVTTMVLEGAGKETIEKEIAKCDLVCACRHRVRTHVLRAPSNKKKTDLVVQAG